MSFMRIPTILMAWLLFYCLSGCNKPLNFQQADTPDTTQASVQHRKVLLITLCGARGNVLKEADVPAIKSLLPQSVYSWDAVSDTVTTDAAAWAALYTGVPSVQSGVNGDNYKHYLSGQYPAFPLLLQPGTKTVQIINAEARKTLNDSLLPADKLTLLKSAADDQAVTQAAVSRLKDSTQDLLMVTFDAINEAGKTHGYSDTSTAYLKAMHQTDTYISQILAALKARPQYSQENWLIILTSDHGGTDQGSYGENNAAARNTFVIYFNSAFSAKEIKMPLVNVPYDGTYPFFERTGNVDHAAYTNNPAYHFGSDKDFTIEFNINTLTSGSESYQNPIVSNKNWDDGKNPGWVVYLYNGLIGYNFATKEGLRVDQLGGPFVADGKWHHISVSFNRQGNISIYMDGKFFIAGGSIKDGGNTDSGLPMGVGTDGTLDFNWGTLKSTVSDVRIWDKLLDPATIFNWSFITVTPEHPDYTHLIGYWKFNDPTEISAIKDYSKTDAPLTVIGGLSWNQISGVLNYSQTDPSQQVPKSFDVSLNILVWMGVKIQPDTGLPGTLWLLN